MGVDCLLSSHLKRNVVESTYCYIWVSTLFDFLFQILFLFCLFATK